MVKIPKGKKVTVNLWNTKKKSGIVKYFTDTMELVRAESDFKLNKGDFAYIVESYESFVVIVPEDEYTRILNGIDLKNIDADNFNHLINNLLIKNVKKTGGILSFDQIWFKLQQTSIKGLVKKNDLRKFLKKKKKNIHYDILLFNNEIFAVLKIHQIPDDIYAVLDLGKKFDFLSKNIIQSILFWSDLRIERVLDHLLLKNEVKIRESYRTGKLYYINSVKEIMK